MRRISVVLVACAAMALSAAAFADPVPPPSGPVVVGAPPPGAKTPEEGKRMAKDAEVVCFNDLDTGSHLRRTRVCMTRAERDQRQKEGGDAMDAMKDAGRQPLSCGPGQRMAGPCGIP